jgi:hypothetical protein
VKNKLSVALVALILFAICLPGFVSAQKRDQNSAGTTTSGKTGTTPPAAARRPRVHAETSATAITQDFSEALSVIQEHYIDGNKLDFNDVYKSSILGMLRSLDPLKLLR